MCYIGVHIGATWRIRLNRPCLGGPYEAAAMLPYVKLLRPLVIIRPHRSTAYVDAGYCYRPSIAWSVGLLVCLSVCRFVTVVSSAKTAEPIGMPFGL